MEIDVMVSVYYYVFRLWKFVKISIIKYKNNAIIVIMLYFVSNQGSQKCSYL